MITLSDVEWMLSSEFDVYRREEMLIISLGNLNGFASTSDFLGTPVVTIQFIPCGDLPPSPALYRWVAITAGKFTLGSLSAALTDDGLVDLWFRHSLFDSSLEEEDIRLVVRILSGTASDLRQEATSLFS